MLGSKFEVATSGNPRWPRYRQRWDIDWRLPCVRIVEPFESLPLYFIVSVVTLS